MEKIDLDKIETDIDQFFKISKHIENNIKSAEKIDEKIELTKVSIDKEILLKKFPSQAIGSVVLYNELNEKFSFYADNQFNKIIRFLEHLENKEIKYRDLYLNCTGDYITDPNGIPFDELIKEKKEIDNCYELLSILVREVNSDIVKFNKVYNKLEDAGLFMTMPEKANQQYLLEISTKLDNVIEGLKVLFQSLEETNNSLRQIEGNTSEIALNMYDVKSDLWDIASKT